MKRKPLHSSLPGPNNLSKVLVLLYMRVSTEDQEREGFSIPAQTKLLREYARSLNLEIVQEFVDIESAKCSGRASYAEMLKFMRDHPEVRTVLVEKVDRLYRNLKDYVTLDDLDCVLHFVKENQVISKDSRSSDKFMHGIKVLIAKNFIDNLKEEVRKGMLEKADQGLWPSRAPLGYLNVLLPSGKRGIVPDPTRADLVRECFVLYATGTYSVRHLARWARTAGLNFRKSGRPINKATLNAILRNRIYTGEFDFDGVRYNGIHVPIVSLELWNRVQAMLDGRYSKRYRVVKHDLPFAGLTRCGHCGCAMVGEIKKGKYIYYHCTGEKGKCPEKYVRQEVIEQSFGDAIGRIVIPCELASWAADMLRKTNNEESEFHYQAISRLEEEHLRLKRRLEALYVDKLDGQIALDLYEHHADEWRKTLARIQNDLDLHRSGNRQYLLQGAQLLELAANAQKLYEKQLPSEKRRLLNFVVSNSTWKDSELKVTFRQPFDLFSTWRETMKKPQERETLENGQNEEWLLR